MICVYECEEPQEKRWESGGDTDWGNCPEMPNFKFIFPQNPLSVDKSLSSLNINRLGNANFKNDHQSCKLVP